MELSYMQLCWTVIAAGAITWAMTLLSVFVGGLLVFRTKRESYESFLPKPVEEKTAINIDEADYSSQPEQNLEQDEDPVRKIFDRFEQQNLDFLKQMAADKQRQEAVADEEGEGSHV